MVQVIQHYILSHILYKNSFEPINIFVNLQLSNSELVKDNLKKLAFNINYIDTIKNNIAFPLETIINKIKKDNFINFN